jgi:hypothetical protein
MKELLHRFDGGKIQEQTVEWFSSNEYIKINMASTYHIYLKDRCLFKNLDEQEFEVIWGRLYRSYWDDITYSEVTDIPTEKYIEDSY